MEKKTKAEKTNGLIAKDESKEKLLWKKNNTRRIKRHFKVARKAQATFVDNRSDVEEPDKKMRICLQTTHFVRKKIYSF